MADRTADEHILIITSENQTISSSKKLKSGVTSYKGTIISDNAGYADQFATADGVEISGVQISSEVEGDDVKTIKVWSKFTLKNQLLTGVAATDVRKPVWASGAMIPETTTDTQNLSLTYTEGAKLFGFVRKYRSTGRADIYVDPKPLIPDVLPLGHVGYAELANGLDPFIGNFGFDFILNELQSTPRFQLAAAGYEANCVVINNTDVVTGTLMVIDDAYTLGTTVVQALTGAYLYVTAGVNITVDVASVGGSGNPTQGECDLALQIFKIPACEDF